MKAISVRQPWAWAIVHGGKDVENRGRPDPWRSAIGERVFVHAAKTIEADDYAEVRRLSGRTPLEPLPLGALTGRALVKDVHHWTSCCRNARTDVSLCSRWAQFEQWHVVLGDVVPMAPVPWRGALGLFDVSLDLLTCCCPPDGSPCLGDHRGLCAACAARFAIDPDARCINDPEAAS